MRVKTNGFPNEVGRTIDMPDAGYLITLPMFSMAPIQYVLQRCSNFQKKLISEAPLRKDRKNILVTSFFHLMVPNYSPTSNRLGNTFEWHIDGSGKLDDRFTRDPKDLDLFHVFCGGCQATTEFDEGENIIDISFVKDHVFDFNNFLNSDGYTPKPKAIEPNCWVTFSNNIHRPPNPKGHEFRFFMNIVESDNITEVRQTEWIQTKSYLFKENYRYPNIEHTGEEIIINYPSEDIKDEISSQRISRE